jgi:hypothetical protein
MRALLVPVLLLSLFAGASFGCASEEAAVKKIPERPTGQGPDTGPTIQEMEQDILAQTRKSAAEQLQCPEDEINVQCTKHDRHSGCIAVQVRGCDKILDYDFGNE